LRGALRDFLKSGAKTAALACGFSLHFTTLWAVQPAQPAAADSMSYTVRAVRIDKSEAPASTVIFPIPSGQKPRSSMIFARSNPIRVNPEAKRRF